MTNTTTCAVCGSEFVQWKTKKYCSDNCRFIGHARARREREVHIILAEGENEDSLQPKRIVAMSEFLSKLQASGKIHK